MKRGKGRTSKAQHICALLRGNNTSAKVGAAAEVEILWQIAHPVHGPTERKTPLTNLAAVVVKGKPQRCKLD